MKNPEDRITKLEEENEDLKTKLIDLSFELNYNKQTELLNFFQELYESLDSVDEKLSKEDIIKNLKSNMKEFAKDNKIMFK